MNVGSTAKPTTQATSHTHACQRGSVPSSPDAATSSGDGVSPAATAAASGSPPGSAAATCAAEPGRCGGSFSRQRKIARSTDGGMSETSADGLVGVESVCACCQSPTVVALNGALPVNASYRIRPSE